MVPGGRELTAFADVICHHCVRYPGMAPSDLYKLVFQGAMGPGHAVSCPASAGEFLRGEMNRLGSGPRDEPLLEPLSPRFGMVRVNLRPYLSLGYGVDALLKAFIGTSLEFRGSEAALLEELMLAADLQSLFPAEEMRGLAGEMAEKGFPAIHHSCEYRELYRPGYRVVGLSELAASIPEAGTDSSG